MRALFIGDSMIKYLHKYISVESLDFHLGIVSYPGATIEKLACNISVHKNYDWVLVHVGTNNAFLDTIEIILKKYRALATDELLHNPGARIIFSSIVSRDLDFHRKEYKESDIIFFCLAKQESARPVSRPVQPSRPKQESAKPVSRPVQPSRPKQESARSVSRPVQPARPSFRPMQPARLKQESTRLISTPVQQSAALMMKDISSLPSSKGNTQFVLPVIQCIPFNQFSENVFRSIPTSNKFSVLATNCKILHGGGSQNCSYSKNCVYCGKTYSTRSSFSNHLKKFKCPQPVKDCYPKLCEKCLKSYSSKSSFSNHLNQCNKSKTRVFLSPSGKNYSRVLETNACLTESVAKPAKDLQASRDIKLTSSVSDICQKFKSTSKVKNTYPRICKLCLKSYSSKSSFSYHLKRCCKSEVQTVSCLPVKSNCIVLDNNNSHKESIINPISDVGINQNVHSSRFMSNNYEKSPKSLKCGRFYWNNAFKSHEETCNFTKKNELFFCVQSDCNQIFSNLWHLNKHHSVVHQIQNIKTFSFDSFKNFKIWLEAESSSTYTFFRKSTGKNVLGDKTFHYYVCQFFYPSYLSRIQSRVERHANRKNRKGVIPFHLNCPVRICVCEHKNLVTVTYYPVHNHHTGYENTRYHPLKENTRNLIKSYLLLSFPVSKILILIRDDVGCRDKRNFSPTKEVFISRKTIQSYSRHLHNTVKPINDAMSVFCTVEKLKNEKYNPILIFKLQKSDTIFGPSYLDSLPNRENSLGFQIEVQKDMLMKYSHKILCIDATHGTNHYDFFLLSLHVQDEYGQGYPVAHFITNDLGFRTLVALFSSLHYLIPNLKVNTVMTNDDGFTFNAFNSVFGPDIKHLLCQWHVYRAWKRQLTVKVHDKCLRMKMSYELLNIMNEKSLEDFENKVSIFISKYLNGRFSQK
ncbi:hypothetical protein HNY73_011491 [Argiope bruennichi]|uniref:C2H2-type domain-containing protein n=1 Tax=Argiope bruennichi TaxID=94029 RepID=A0A8T0F6H6_ARGBR|nr:hypothetical protein HNY73_011491 [Argiope bruennichi]